MAVSRGSSALVEHANPAIARLTVSGFLSEVHVQEGEEVLEGDILVTLASPELHAAAARLDAQVAAAEIRCRQHHRHGDIASYQAESEVLATLQSRTADARQKLTDLTLRAPKSGCVIAPRLDEQLGRYLQEGTEIARIVQEDAKQLFVSIAQDDLGSFGESMDKQVMFVTRHHSKPFPPSYAKLSPTRAWRPMCV